ncbi:MAG: lytic transglycosylase domain-containing protein [Nitrospira sp.]
MEVYQYIDAQGVIALTNVPSDTRYRRIDRSPTLIQQPLSEAELEPTILRFSHRYQLPPALILAVIKAESDFNARAVSRAGAVGLMQLMPQTAMHLNVKDLYDPEDNIGGGTKYLRFLLDKFRGNLPLALAAYNAGEHVVDRYRTLPPIEETQRYVRKVLRYYRTFLMRDRSAAEREPTSSVARAFRQDFQTVAPLSR